MGLCPGLPGWAGTRRNIHPLKPEEEQERFAQTTRSAFRQRGLLDPIKPAYNHSRLDGQLKLTANTFIRLWISMPAVLVAVPELLCRTCCILYQLSPLLLTIFWILWCTDRWQRQMHRKSVWMPPSPNYWCPHFYMPHFYAEWPFCCNPHQFILAWDMHQIMLVCIPSGLVSSL